MKIRDVAVIVSCSLVAASCGQTSTLGTLGAGGIPIETLVAVSRPNSKILYLKGTLSARSAAESAVALHVEGSAVKCSGDMNASGGGHIACDDGLTMELKFPTELYGKTSGSFAGRLAGGSKYAMGWGDHADGPTLQGLLRYER